MTGPNSSRFPCLKPDIATLPDIPCQAPYHAGSDKIFDLHGPLGLDTMPYGDPEPLAPYVPWKLRVSSM